MAKPFFNPVLEGFSRSIGNLTFYRRNGETFTRRKSEPSGVASSAQQAVRTRFTYCADNWRELPSIIKKAWNKAAYPGTGYNRFIGVNSSLYKEGETIRLSEELGMPAPLSYSGTAGSSGAFTVSYTRPGSLSQAEITVFYRPIPAEGESFGSFLSVHRESSASGSIDVTECIRGGTYEVQLIFSDKEISAAEKVSASVSLKVSAGA
jgi:hypothetical protein